MKSEKTIRAAIKNYMAVKGHRSHILTHSGATVRFPEFDPCRASMPIAIVSVPAVINMQPTVINIPVFDGDHV